MTPSELSAALARDAETVCRMLLTGGKRKGHEWHAGSVAGDEGHSLKIELAGPKAGIWADFATDEAGDLIDLWAAARSMTLAEAIRDVQKYLGVEPPRFHPLPERWQPPVKPAGLHGPKPGPVCDYLTSERGLSLEALRVYRVGIADERVVFPFLVDGEPRMIKTLDLSRPGGKKVIKPTSAEQMPCLFGWQAVDDAAREVVITEGEIDAMSSYDMGVPALSVPFGAGNHQWLEAEFDRLDRFDLITLAFDNDDAGRKGVAELIERIGRHRTKVALLPRKDANECLLHDVDGYVAAIAGATTQDPAELRGAETYVEEVIAEMFGAPADVGVALPWKGVAGKVSLRMAELSLLNGINGHGKSQVVGQILLDAMAQGHRCCLASLEMPARRILMRMSRQAAALGDAPSIAMVRGVHGWLAGKLWLFDRVGWAKVERLIEVFRYARARYGITLFAIDSLLKLGIAEDDYSTQKVTVEKLADLKNELNVHILLVTHARKGQGEDERAPGKWDVRGATAITDLCDTGFAIWRNKHKEQALAEADRAGVDLSQETIDKPDMLLTCFKQRNGEWEGRAPLWWHGPSNTYLGAPNAPRKRYVSEVA